MTTPKLVILALALAGASPALAADAAADTKKDVDALKARVAELEKALKAAPAPAAPAPAAAAPAGMTDEQLSEFNRIKVKTEALEDQRDANGFKNLKLTGYMDPTYIFNANKERGTFQFLVPIAKEAYGYDNGYFGTLALDVQKEMDSGTKFHLTLYPKRGGGDVMGENSIVHEASVWVPVEAIGGKIFAGQLPDWSGYEYYAPNQYKNITHNLLFDFILPASYTGVGVEKVVGKWDLKFMLANMNASVRNVGEHVPMFVCRGDYSGGEFWGIGFACAAGKKSNFRPGAPQVDAGGNDSTGLNPITGEPYSTKDTLYLTGEVDGWYTRGDLTLNFHVGYGQQEKAAITANPDTGNLRDSQWAAVSVLSALKVTPRTELVARADYIYNRKNGGGLLDYTVADPGNGIGPDQKGGDPSKGADRYALTLGLNYNVDPSIIWKLEARYDGATQNVFGNKDVFTGGTDPKFTKSNFTAGTAIVYSF